jgi:hypothetical protein
LLKYIKAGNTTIQYSERLNNALGISKSMKVILSEISVFSGLPNQSFLPSFHNSSGKNHFAIKEESAENRGGKRKRKAFCYE